MKSHHKKTKRTCPGGLKCPWCNNPSRQEVERPARRKNKQRLKEETKRDKAVLKR